MFSNLNKSTFGTTNSAPTFGFGSTSSANQTPFSQTHYFGKSNAAGFGQMAPLFGSTPQQNTAALFPNSTLPTFGATASQTGFGSGLFGQQQNAGVVSSGTSGLFPTTSSSAFGQQSKSPSFAFGTANSTLFGQQQNQNFQPSTSGTVFGSTPGFGTSTQLGTVVKFNPTTGTDTMQKSGVSHSINTKHHCITCMKEYEGKSLEELRFEDYQANRKGPQTGFGPTPFGTAVSTAPSLFGQPDNKTVFGQSSNFGSSTTSGFNMTNQPTQPTLFGKPTTGFGATPTTNAFNFSTTSSTFGANKSFSNQPTQNVFGTSTSNQPSTSFAPNLFPSTTTAPGIFGKTTAPTAFTSSQQPAFTFNQVATTQPNYFSQSKPTTGFNNFGSSNLNTTASFGQPSTLFPSQPTQNPFNPMQKSNQSTFGTPLQTGFGLGTQANTTSFFGSNKPLFGGTTQSNFFNAPSTPFAVNQQPPLTQMSTFAVQSAQVFQSHVEQLYEPFPHYDFLLDTVAPKTHHVTNPTVLKDIIDEAPVPMTSIQRDIKKHRTLINSQECKYALLDDCDKHSTSNNLLTKNFMGKKLHLQKNPIGDKSIIGLEDKKNSLFRNLQQLTHLNNEHFTGLELSKTFNQERTTSNSDTSDFSCNVKNYMEATLTDKCETPKVNHISLSPNQELNTDKNLSGSKLEKCTVLPGSLKGTRHRTVTFQANEVSSSSDSNSNENQHNSFNANALDESKNDTEGVDDNWPNRSPEILNELTCGVILTGSDYYTKPPLNRLHNYRNEKGECIVKGFTIARSGFGKIFFPEVINVANLNLDEIIKFHFREITVYPDDSKKPPVGQGLNCRAEITIEQVWPRDKASQEIIKDIKEITKTNFIQKLRLLANKQNAKFLDYHPDTGSWSFSVEHFSKYGYFDSDEDYIQTVQIQKLLSGRNRDESSGDEFEECEKMGLGGMQSLDSSFYQSVSNSPDTSSGHEIEEEEEPDEFPSTVFIRSSFFGRDLLLQNSSTSRSRSLDSNEESDSEVITEMNNEIGTEMLCDISVGDQFIEHYALLSDGNEFANDEIEMIDINDEPARFFKVRWCQRFKLITKHALKKNVLSVNDFYSNYISIMDVSEAILGDTNYLSTESHCEVVLKWSLFTKDDLGFPCLSIKKSSEILLELQASYFNSKYNQLWTLCTALWGPRSTNYVEKREMFSQWLEANTSSISTCYSYRRSPDTNVLLADLYNYLVYHEVGLVSDMAMHQDFPALSVLCAQTQNTTRQLLQTQCEQWYNNGTFQCMEPFTKKMYVLLGGLTNFFGVNVFEELSWKEIVSLYLWYICPTGVKLDYAVDKYKDAFDTLLIATSPETKHANFISEKAFDVEYHILRLNGNPTMNLKTVLNPASHTKHSENFSLSWFLMQMFSAIRVGKISNTLMNNVNLRFAAQLEKEGLWQWSIFVLLFVKERALKYQTIKQILERNYYTYYSDSTRSFLLHTLKIPARFLHPALAVAHCKMGNHLQTFRHLTLMNDWYNANQVALTHIIPSLILNQKYETLLCMLAELGRGLNHNIAIGTNVILDFLKIKAKVCESQCRRGLYYDECEITAKLFSLFKCMHLYPVKSLLHSLMISEISKYVRSLSIACYNTLHKNKFKQLDKLPLIMPQDYDFFHGTAPSYYYNKLKLSYESYEKCKCLITNCSHLL